ncbi:glycosyltransferase family 39 protein [Candidatus Woesearchaeota archaeon]|nr:glycosyltransferase family 39 protein [Candidatus Woesearchaeota archaeon]
MIITKKEIYWVILIVIIAFLLRILFFSLHNTVELDGAYYISLGTNFINNFLYRDLENNLNTNLTPGMPVAIGLMDLIFNNSVLSARLVSALFGAFSIIFVYLFTKRLFTRKEAYIAAFLTASYTVLVYISTLTYNDSLYLFLFLGGLYFGWLGLMKEKSLFYVLTGLFFSVAYLTRPEGFLLPFILIFYWLVILRRFNLKTVLGLGLMLFIFLLISFPWLNFIHENTGKWQVTTKGGFTYLQREYKVFSDEYEKNLFSLNEDKNRIRLNPYNQTIETSVNEYILENPGKFIKRYFVNFGMLIFDFLVKVFPFVFLLVAFYGFKDKKDRKLEIYLLFFIFYPFLISPVFGSESRWLLGGIPLLLIWVSRGIIKIEKWNENLNSKIITLILVLLMIISVFFVNSFTPKIYEKDDQPIEHKIAGLWFKDNIGEGKVIMERRPWVSFYSSGRFVYLPYADFKEMIEYGCKNNVEYLVADSKYLGKLRPQLKSLLDDNFNDLKTVYINHFKDKVVKIYRLEC